MSSFSALKGFSILGQPTCTVINPIKHNFIDIGVNILDDMFRGVYNGKQKHTEDINNVLLRSSSLGVTKIIATGGCIEESIKAMKLCRELNLLNDNNSTIPVLYSTVGVHPTRSNEFIDNEIEVISQLEEIIIDGSSDGTVVAIGECGLDYDRLQFSSKENQIKGFHIQLDLSSRFNLPMFLHNRNTNGDFLQIITQERSKLTRGGVVHSFDGSTSEMLALCELGLYIGINGCSLRTEDNLEMIAKIPEHLLLLETDAPWCGIKNTHPGKKHLTTVFPVKKNDKYETGVLLRFMVKDRSEPCSIVSVFEVVAAVRGVTDLIKFSKQIYENTMELFFNIR